MTAAVSVQSAVASIVAGVIEGSGIPFPGGVLLTAAGTAIPTLLAALILATLFSVAYLVSATVQYYLGLFCGPFLERLLPSGTKGRLERMMRRYGEGAVLWTRPLAIGNYISIPAGMMRMPMGKFLAFTFLGIWPWAFVMAAAGTYLGATLAPIPDWVWYVAGLAAAFLLVTGLLIIWQRFRRASTTFCD